MNWLQQRFEDTQLMMLLASLLGIFVLLILLGDILAPLLVAIALAYVLDGVVDLLCHCRVPRLPAILLVGTGAMLIVLFAMLSLLPLLTEQIGRLIGQVPQYVQAMRTSLHDLQAHYAGWINPEYLQQLLAKLAETLQGWGGDLLSFSLSSIPGLITLLVYAVIVPVLVFFLLKDKDKLIVWGQRFLPRDRALLHRVWGEVDIQIGNYIRGKFWESFIVGIAMWLVFWLMGHEYALLLGTLTGISVWIPFVGAAVVTIPVVLLSFFQWGWTETTLYSLIAYTIIQALDANVIVPWLFSEIVNMHPIAIVVAILVFGSLWGVLGVFIAIPMAALVQSVLAIVLERNQPNPETSSPV
ncbi:MAG: AI-2E family transporter [Mariprofundaceae bacterium]